MLKEPYDRAELEVIVFTFGDVLTISDGDIYEGWNPNDPGGSGDDGYEGWNPQ